MILWFLECWTWCYCPDTNLIQLHISAISWKHFYIPEPTANSRYWLQVWCSTGYQHNTSSDPCVLRTGTSSSELRIMHFVSKAHLGILSCTGVSLFLELRKVIHFSLHCQHVHSRWWRNVGCNAECHNTQCPHSSCDWWSDAWTKVFVTHLCETWPSPGELLTFISG